MCEYCNGEKGVMALLSSDGFDLHIMELRGQYIVEVDYYGYDEDRNSDFEIDFCPKCGRDLEKEVQ